MRSGKSRSKCEEADFRFVLIELNASVANLHQIRPKSFKGNCLISLFSLFSNFPRSRVCLNAIRIDGELIREVKNSKFLGVFIDSGVSWRVHISRIVSKISQTVGIIARARGFMNGPQLFLLYNTMVLPHLQYCLLNWGNFKGDRNLGLRDRLLALQKSLVRIICGASRISHADPLFAELATLKIDDLFAQSVRIFSYKLSKDMLPGAMASMISPGRHGYSTRGAKSNFFVCQ